LPVLVVFAALQVQHWLRLSRCAERSYLRLHFTISSSARSSVTPDRALGETFLQARRQMTCEFNALRD